MYIYIYIDPCVGVLLFTRVNPQPRIIYAHISIIYTCVCVYICFILFLDEEDLDLDEAIQAVRTFIHHTYVCVKICVYIFHAVIRREGPRPR